MDEDLARRVELLKQMMAEPITAPAERNADLWFRYLMEKLDEYRRGKCQHGLNRHECGQCSG